LLFASFFQSALHDSAWRGLIVNLLVGGRPAIAGVNIEDFAFGVGHDLSLERAPFTTVCPINSSPAKLKSA
jgi:hypothetical protein